MKDTDYTSEPIGLVGPNLMVTRAWCYINLNGSVEVYIALDDGRSARAGRIRPATIRDAHALAAKRKRARSKR